MLFFWGAVLLIISLIFLRFLIRKTFWFTNNVVQGRFRKKDLLKLLATLMAIAIFEFIFPTFGFTGRPYPVTVDQTLQIRETMKIPENTPTLSKLSENHDWLYPFSQKAADQRKVKLQYLNNVFESEITKTQILLKKIISNKSNAANKDATEKDNLLEEDRKELKRKQPQATANYLTAFAKITEEKKQIEEQERIFAGDTSLRTFDKSISLINRVRYVNFKETRRIDKLEKPLSADHSVLVVGPAKTEVIDIASDLGKLAYTSLKGNVRSKAKKRDTFSCNLGIKENKDEQFEIERFCEISHPLPLNYDLVSTVCSPKHAVKQGDSNPFCLERWNLPQFNIQIFKDRLIFFAPKPLDKEFKFLDTNLNSSWNLKFGNLEIPLNDVTEIAFPETLNNIHEFQLVHKPLNDNVRIFSDVDTEFDWFGNSSLWLDGPEIKDRFSFKNIEVNLNVTADFNRAMQFVGKVQTKPSQNPWGVISALDETITTLKQFGADNTPKCLISRYTSKPGIFDKVQMKKNYGAIDELKVQDSNKPDCEKLSIVYALAKALKLSYSQPDNK